MNVVSLGTGVEFCLHTHLQWHATKEEGPAVSLPTLLAELLEIEQLPDWDAPASQQPLMEEKGLILAWICFKARHISHYGSQFTIPYPAQHGLGRFYPNHWRCCIIGQLLTLRP